MADGEFSLEVEISFEDILEVVLKVRPAVRSVVADGRRKFRTLRSPSHEASDEAPSSSLGSSTSMSWSVASGEACVKVVSIGLRVDDMAVKCRVSHLSDGRCHVIYPT